MRRHAQAEDAVVAIAGSHVGIEAANGGTGSGTVVAQTARNSYVLTCAHVVKADRRCEILFDSSNHGRGKYTVNGIIERVDAENDLALIRTAHRILAPIELAEEPYLYERLWVMGAPDGLWGTAAPALLCNLDAKGYIYTGLAAPGMSGGSLCNLEGQLLGVIRDVKTDSGAPVWNIGFAVPLPAIRAFLDKKAAKK